MLQEETTRPDADGGTAAAPPFFIVGNDRSGTTMLRLILDRGDELAIPTESMIVGDFAHVRRDGASLASHPAATAFASRVWNHPKVALWSLPGDAPVPPEGLGHEAAYRFAIEAPYRAFAARDGKARWGDKTPCYLEWVDEIKAVWPEARLVEIVRDGRDVALSIMPLPFGGNNAWVAGRDWARGIRLGRAAAERYPDDVFTVRYEDLAADPEPCARAICDFLGIGFHPDMLDLQKTGRDRIVADQAAWFTNIWSGINQRSVGKWRTKMSARDQAIFAAAAGDELALHGYDPGDHAGTVTVGPLRAAAFQVSNFSSRLVNLVRLRIVQERGRELGYVIRRRLRRGA